MFKYLLIIALLLQFFTVPQDRYYPAQYIAKLYTEALSRTPDQAGYFGYAQYLQRKGCNSFNVQVVGSQILNSTEFNSFNLNNDAKVLILYRSLLNREPETDEFSIILDTINTKGWQAAVDKFLKSKEFLAKIPTICGKGNDKNRLARYGWSKTATYILQPKSEGFSGNEEQLRSLIRFLPVGSTFWLAQQHTIFLTRPLVVNKGITLQTVGNPKHYAEKARFVRANNFSGSGEPMLRLENATLKDVWVDGDGHRLPYNVWDINVQTVKNDNIVENCKVENSAGFSNIQALGLLEGFACNSAVIKNNLITGYTSDNFPNAKTFMPWVDGITVSCENSNIEGNQIVDTSDVAIVVFNPVSGGRQNSVVRNNTIFNAGNSIFAAINTDHIFAHDGRDFSGVLIDSNLLWTSNFSTMRTGLSVGSGLWSQLEAGGYGFGAQFINNTTGIGFIKAQYGILIHGMRNATVLNNKLNVKLNPIYCGKKGVFAGIDTAVEAFNTNLDFNYKVDNYRCQ